MHARDWRMVAAAGLSQGTLAIALLLPACTHTSTLPAPGLGSPACPRDAILDAGRCTCPQDRVLVLGACVEPAVRDAYCGPAARGASGATCAFRTCAAGEALDDSGRCIPVNAVARSGPRCEAPAAVVVTGEGHAACVPPDAACPRGTSAEGETCRPAPSCPAGALWTGRDCHAVVTTGPHGPVVDLGVWAAIVLGVSGGPASAELCRPLESAPLAFDVTRGDRLDVRLAISVAVPDQDVSRVFASIEARAAQGHALSPAATRLVGRALGTLIEPLRGLGGESSSAAVQVEVRCAVAFP